MDSPGTITRYRSLSRARALGVMLLAAGAVAACLATANARSQSASGTAGPADIPLYKRVVERLRAGEPYYDVLRAELPARRFATRSVFNWRTPLHLELIAHLPEDGGRMLLMGLGLAAVALCALALARAHGAGLAALQSLLLAIPLSAAFMPVGYLFGEMWAGVLIAMSIAAYALGWRRCGLVAAFAALFLRELALPYVGLCLLFALWERRRVECWLWVAGAGVWTIYLGLHAMAVAAHMPPAAESIAGPSWLRFGGIDFLLSTSRVGLLLAFPLAVTAVYLPLAVLGAFAPTGPMAARLAATVATYLLAFSIVGLPANFYWGGVYSPLLALGAAWTLPACRDLLHALRSPV